MALGGRGYRLPPLNAIEEARCVPDERQSLTPGSLMRQAAHGGGNMSEQLQLVYELNIIPGKAEEVREIARDMVTFNDEGEPGTFKYRYYLERDPHRFIEGMLIAAEVIVMDCERG